ncbi:hypothetical protein GQ600_2833 [Phytophthora cactorum]|nr:hypothetical protein GQ600_2833 [Phytophthora cactorum]
MSFSSTTQATRVVFSAQRPPTQRTLLKSLVDSHESEGESAVTKAVNALKASDGGEACCQKSHHQLRYCQGCCQEGDAELAKLSAMIAESAKKDPTSWLRLNKFTKIMLGINVGGLALYGAYRILTDNN